MGIAGLIVGFAISFFWTTSINKKAKGASPDQSAGMGGPAPSTEGQQAAMGSVRQIIDKAKNSPNDFDAQMDAARAYDQIGRTKEAVDYLEKAYNISADRSAQMEAPAYIAQYYSDQKNYDQAVSWFEKQLKTKPDDPEVTIELGATYIERQPADPDKAIPYLKSVLDKNPKNTHALMHLAQAYLEKKDAASAQDAVNRIKEAEPDNKNLATLQGQVDAVKAGQPVTIP